MRPTCKIYMCDVDRCAYMFLLWPLQYLSCTQHPDPTPSTRLTCSKDTSLHIATSVLCVQQNRDTAGDLQPADTLVCGPIIKPRVCGTGVGAPDSTFPFVRRAGPFEFENETQRFGSVLALFARVIQ